MSPGVPRRSLPEVSVGIWYYSTNGCNSPFFYTLEAVPTAAPVGPSEQILLAVCVQYSTKTFKDDKWAVHYYAPIQGHELVARRDLIPSEPDHPRAGDWY
jgi:hypothetical protein